MATFTAYPNADGYYDSSASLTNGSSQWIAGNAFFGYSYVARFTNVTIAKNSTISDATFTFWYNSGGGTPAIRLALEAADNPSYPSSRADAAGRTITTNYWDYSRAWNASFSSTSYTTGSWHASAQEVVDRAGWASGQAWQLFFRDNSSPSYAYVQCYGIAETGTSMDPSISVTYTEPAKPAHPFLRRRTRTFQRSF